MLILTLMTATAIAAAGPIEPAGFDLGGFAQSFDEDDRSAWELPDIDEQDWDGDDVEAGARLKMRALKLKLSVPI